MNETILSILEELASVSGKLDKLAILESRKENEMLRRVFYMALNPLINYGIKKIPDCDVHTGEYDLDWATDQLEFLISRKYTGHAARDHLYNILNSVSPDEAEVVRRIVSRDLKCGAAKGTVEKTWPKLIPSLPCMLAQPMKEKTLAKINYPAIAQLKSDGARCISLIDGDDVAMFSRNCKEYHGLDCLKEKILSFVGDWGPVVLDGELLVTDDDGNILERKVGNGFINKSSKGTISPAESANIIYTVWDIIPLQDYMEGKYDVAYSIRMSTLDTCIENDRVSIIETHTVKSLEEAKVIFRGYVDQGLEGILLKNRDGIWEDKRSRNQVKFKEEIHSDFIVTDLIEGTGKYEGMLGAVTCQTKCGQLIVNCGSGFNDEQREHYWNNPDEILNRVIEVKHNGVIDSEGKDTYCVFLPIFQYVREDKELEDADTVESIDG